MNIRTITAVAMGIALLGPLCAGTVLAGYEEGEAALRSGDYETAFREYSNGAQLGDPNAQAGLGFLYDQGLGVAADHEKAVDWYRKAAEQGHVEAQAALGYFYAYGGGVPRDYGKAAEWFRKAAERGSTLGQFGLGLLYFSGNGVPKDNVRAFAWLSLAVAQGDPTNSANVAYAVVAAEMTPSQRQEGEALAREYFEKYVVPFRKGE
jgi:TPR repeat protein